MLSIFLISLIRPKSRIVSSEYTARTDFDLVVRVKMVNWWLTVAICFADVSKP